MSQTATESGPSIEQIGAALAQTLANATGSAVTTTVTPALGAGMSGTVDIGLLIGTTTYELTVTIPTGGAGPYDFKISMTPQGGTQSTLAEFKFKDAADWSVTASLPTGVTFGPLQKLSVTLQDGNPGT